MHTAICAFDERRQADEAIDALVRAGFARHDVHMEHKHVNGEGRIGDHRNGSERETPGSRGALSGLGHFFASLLGRDNPSGHADTYSDYVERGGFVVVVDAHDDGEAQRARTLMQGLQAGAVNVVQRQGQPPLREIVGRREGVAGMLDRSTETYEGGSGSGTAALAQERAMASNRLDAISRPELRSPELEHPPGLRYADQDKPNG